LNNFSGIITDIYVESGSVSKLEKLSNSFLFYFTDAGGSSLFVFVFAYPPPQRIVFGYAHSFYLLILFNFFCGYVNLCQSKFSIAADAFS